MSDYDTAPTDPSHGGKLTPDMMPTVDVKVEKLENCFMVSIDGRDIRQFDFSKSVASEKRAQAEAIDFAVQQKRARMALDQFNK